MFEKIILPDFVLPSRMQQTWNTSGMDSSERCRDKKHFESYGHPVVYQYNSRGYRDNEWPVSIQELKHGIWCLGDSFTVGIGSPLEHTWCNMLQQATNTRTINVSMDGASNNWIARKAIRVLQEISPQHMIIHWSYVWRREYDIASALDDLWNEFYSHIRDPSWPKCQRQHLHKLPPSIKEEIKNKHGGWVDDFASDDNRLLHHISSTDPEDIENTLSCIAQLAVCNHDTQIIHSFIPDFVRSSYKGQVEATVRGLVIPELVRLDLARDGHHYDRLTSQYFVDQISMLLN